MTPRVASRSLLLLLVTRVMPLSYTPAVVLMDQDVEGPGLTGAGESWPYFRQMFTEIAASDSRVLYHLWSPSQSDIANNVYGIMNVSNGENSNIGTQLYADQLTQFLMPPLGQ